MPNLCIILHNYFPSLTLALLMPPKALDESTTQNPTTSPNTKDNDHSQASILVFISAQAIGSVGFAMSILAIWFGWLLPASIASTTPTETTESKKARSPPPKHHRRRPSHIAPIAVPPPTPLRRASAPVDVTPTPILSSRPEDASATPRHVYFEDSSSPAIARRNTLPAAPHSSMLLDTAPLTSTPFTTSPLGATSVLPDTDEVAADSDSSPHSSKASLTKHSSRLHKLKIFGNGKAAPRLDLQDKPGDQASITSTETNSSEKSTRRVSGGFVAAWSLSRTRTTLDVSSVESPSPSRLSFARRQSPARPLGSPAAVAAAAVTTPTTPRACDIRSPTFLTRKKQHRVSAPIPRTSPYGAPYFAAPPLLLDNTNYPSYLKTLPQFEDEVHGAEPERGRGRTASIRRVVVSAGVPKQRSASMDITTRPTS